MGNDENVSAAGNLPAAFGRCDEAGMLALVAEDMDRTR